MSRRGVMRVRDANLGIAPSEDPGSLLASSIFFANKGPPWPPYDGVTM